MALWVWKRQYIQKLVGGHRAHSLGLGTGIRPLPSTAEPRQSKQDALFPSDPCFPAELENRHWPSLSYHLCHLGETSNVPGSWPGCQGRRNHYLYTAES